MRPMNGRAKMEKGAIGMEVVLLVVLIGLLHGMVFPFQIAARKGQNLAAAYGSMRQLLTAQSLFYDQDLDKDGIKNYAQTLKVLGNLQLIDAPLATGVSQGYVFDLTTPLDRLHWKAVASPQVPGQTGDTYLVADDSSFLIQAFFCPGMKFDPILLQCVANATLIESIGLGAANRLNQVAGGLALPMAENFLMSPANVQKALSALDSNHDGLLTFDEVLNADLLAAARSVQPGLGGAGGGGQPVVSDAVLQGILRTYQGSLRMAFALGAGNERMPPPAVPIAGMTGDPVAFLTQTTTCLPDLECF